MKTLKKRRFILCFLFLAGLISQYLVFIRPCRSFSPDDYEYEQPTSNNPPSTDQMFFIDDFEYWDSPYNHGWLSSDYTYPFMGYGIGYGSFLTQFDLNAGNRVLTVSSLPSAFNRFQPYCLANFHLDDPRTGRAPDKTILSYKVKAHFSIELFNQVRCYLLIKTKENKWLWLCYFPAEGEEVMNFGKYLPPIFTPYDEAQSPLPCLGYPLGRGIQDSTWHLITRDTQQDLDQAVKAGLLTSPQQIEGIYGILFSGNNYSLDEICLLENQAMYKNRQPYIWNPGPQYATIFTPFELILHAADSDNDEISFQLQVGGCGIDGVPVNERFSLIPLGPDPNDTRPSARVALRFTPQVFEDLNISVKVSDKYSSRTTTFPLTVVNYPVSNHPPVIQRVGFSKRKTYNAGQDYLFQAKAFDQDNDQLTYSVLLNDLPSFLFEPAIKLTINPQTGMISFFSIIEDVFKITLIVQDGKGTFDLSTTSLSIINQGTWFNHSPTGGGNIKSPYLAYAGTFFTLITYFSDPDNDQLYYSSSTGSMSKDGVFSFLTYFPGFYTVNIVAYDLYGQSSTLNFTLNVQPWWSY